MSLLKDTSLAAVEDIIGHKFGDSSKLWEALQAKGSPVSYINGRHILEGNKRLALIGDAVLRLALSSKWYAGNGLRGKRQHRMWSAILLISILGGFQSEFAFIGSNNNLDAIGRQWQLQNFIVNNPSQGEFVSSGTMATTVEAILGAVYLDGGLSAVEQVMARLGLAAI